MSEPLVIFVHIPKTAGRTLRAIIRRQYRPEEVCTTSREAGDPIQDFLALSEAEKARLRIVQGHFSYGLHEHVSRPAVYVTMLREPIARVISYYRFMCDNPNHNHHAAAIDLGLDGFLRSRMSKAIDNGQLRYLAAVEDIPFGACTDAMLDAALANLEQRFVAVGLVEAFDDSILLMRRALGWGIPAYMPLNVSKHRVGEGRLTDETLALLRDYNRFDLQIYEYARRRFQAAVEAAGAHLTWDRRRLTLMNRLFALRSGRSAT